MESFLIVGLGNPEPKYYKTRHNAGFNALDCLADSLNVSISKKTTKGLLGECIYKGNKLYLLKPLTYMNLSGESVAAVASFYKIDLAHIIVIVDDINFPPGKIRIRERGSAGGHNGMKNIILLLGSDEFMRIRIGVGTKDPKEDLKDHVLGRFNSDDARIMEKVYRKAAEATLTIVDKGVERAMNEYNGRDFAP